MNATNHPGRTAPREQRVLLVEDEPDVVRALEAMLQHPEIDIQSAVDGGTALEKARRYKPDLIVLDVKLPVMDGFQVFQALRRDPAFRARVIFLSAYMPPGALEIARELGAHACFQKPFQPETLRDTIFGALDLPLPQDEAPAESAPRRAAQRPHVALVSADSIGQAVAAAVREAVGEDASFVQHTSAVAALRNFRIAMPDVAIVDLELPDLDGLSFLKLLKSDFQLSWVPVIALTKSADWMATAVALEAGAEGQAMKPIAHDEIVRIVRDSYRARTPSGRPR